MKKLFTLSFILFSFFARADYWTQRSSFPGSNRDGCFSFSIGNKGYFGCGYDTGWACTQTFWEYNQQINTWTQKADFAGPARIYATGFAISNVGFAGGGVSPAAGWFQDFWKYDPSTNVWSPIADFGGGPRSEMCSFIINGKAYAGTGTGTVSPYTFNDLWEYNPFSNVWTSKAALPGFPRVKAIGFSAGNFGYIATGYDVSAYYSDLWQYNSVTDTWQQKTAFPADPRGGTAGFTLYGELFFGTGNNQNSSGGLYASKDWWVYNVNQNAWTQKNSFSSTTRYETGFFTIGNKGYVGIGLNMNVMYNDFWEYTPDVPSGINESTNNSLQFKVFPNPAKDFIDLDYPLTAKENMDITIRDVLGKMVYSQQHETQNTKHETKINVSSFRQGLYFIEIIVPDYSGTGGTVKAVQKFVKE